MAGAPLRMAAAKTRDDLRLRHGPKPLLFSGPDPEEKESPKHFSECDLEVIDLQNLARLTTNNSQSEEHVELLEEYERYFWDWDGAPPEELFPAIFKPEPLANFEVDELEENIILPADTALDATLIAELERRNVAVVVSEAKRRRSLRKLRRY